MQITFRARPARVALAVVAAGTLLAGAASGVGAAAPEQRSAGHHQPSEAEIRALFDDWNDALATEDPEAVADLYAPDAVLEPTLSDVIRTDRAGIVDYFEHFLLQRPSGEIDASYVELLGRDAAVDSGAYTFTLTDPETGEVSEVPARYTFVYERDTHTGAWRIVNHHSSAMPEG
ncbi:SgcJ/EcaC family oxidoreductase [Streptomyces radicis]|uniref:SgcJ/EcaC family oxidoreductase n=1 Tax=Streptomyces radicis TaxID=1750517 RepID=A0A3A9WGU7_9ACTN|nr:SgcJ/EcaC family oxidoreductase [Streptomyces radicis]RKN11533.1 SgcJ/EcaC family oxidoreductase [Streptomyces radicis]RKN26449.1 SgcJ/EcaC family oxidoreductase [Streptomyces radicis]